MSKMGKAKFDVGTRFVLDHFGIVSVLFEIADVIKTEDGFYYKTDNVTILSESNLSEDFYKMVLD